MLWETGSQHQVWKPTGYNACHMEDKTNMLKVVEDLGDGIQIIEIVTFEGKHLFKVREHVTARYFILWDGVFEKSESAKALVGIHRQIWARKHGG